MSEWRKIWPNGLPNQGRSPRSGHRMAAEGMSFPWRWNGDTISLNLGVIWEMSIKAYREKFGAGAAADIEHLDLDVPDPEGERPTQKDELQIREPERE